MLDREKRPDPQSSRMARPSSGILELISKFLGSGSKKGVCYFFFFSSSFLTVSFPFRKDEKQRKELTGP